MLVGPSQKLSLPPAPRPESGIEGILKYLEELERTLVSYTSSLVNGSIGMIGVRGLSSSGQSAQNFVARIPAGDTNTATWLLGNTETNTSYMLFYSSNYPASMIIQSVSANTTAVTLTITTGLSGMYLDILLLR